MFYCALENVILFVTQGLYSNTKLKSVNYGERNIELKKVVDNGAYLSAINYTQRTTLNKSDQAKYQALIDSIVIE